MRTAGAAPWIILYLRVPPFRNRVRGEKRKSGEHNDDEEKRTGSSCGRIRCGVRGTTAKGGTMATREPGTRLARGSLIFALTGLALTLLRLGAFLGGGLLARAMPSVAPLFLDQGELYISVQEVTLLLILLSGVLAVILGHAAVRQSGSPTNSARAQPIAGFILG